MDNETSLTEDIVKRIDFIVDIIKSYNEHKTKVLFDCLRLVKNFSEAKTKQCGNKSIDIFRGASSVEIVVNYNWNRPAPGFYQAYYPIKSNVYFHKDMDWMELARPGCLPQVPDPLKYTNQENIYPRDLEDERHTKLRLVMNFGNNEYGYDPLFLHVVPMILDLPEKLVINYYFKTFRDKRENSMIQRNGADSKKQFDKMMEEYQSIFGEEVEHLLTIEDLEGLRNCKPANRAFLMTQYYCLHCEVFFCPDHIHSDYNPQFYFDEDKTEYSEFKSDLYRLKRKTHLEIEKQAKLDTSLPPTLQNLVECPTNSKHCFRNNNSDADLIISMIKMEKDELSRAKNVLRVCINCGTNVPCFIESIIPGLTCREIGALMAKLYVDEFRKSPIEPGLSRTDLQQRRAVLDRRKLFSKLEMDTSQFPHLFCEDFHFPIHPHNRLMQKNRVLLGTSTICPGLGLFAGQRFRKDQLVCLYFGEILEEEETSNYRAKINTLYDTSYVFSLSEGTKFSIDSLVYGNKSRFVNHNEGHLNNCVIELTEISKKEYIVFKAKRDIEFGEELFFDYGDSYTLNWKYVYKHMYSFMMKVFDKKKAHRKIRTKLNTTLHQKVA